MANSPVTGISSRGRFAIVSRLLSPLALTLFGTLIGCPQALFSQAGQGELVGNWDLECCVDDGRGPANKATRTIRWTLTITEQRPDGSFSGGFSGNDGGGNVAGRVRGDRIEFDRSGGWGVQHWTADLERSETAIRMVRGAWSGFHDPAHCGDCANYYPGNFHAEKKISHVTTDLEARLICPTPLVLTPGAVRETCTVCVSKWRHNTMDPVQVVYPAQSDWWGTHAIGIEIFAGGNDVKGMISPMSVDPSHMSGLSCPDRPQTFVEYPWNFLVGAARTAPPGPSAIPMVVRQLREHGRPEYNEVHLMLNVVVVGAAITNFFITTSRGTYVTAVNGGGVGGPGALHTDATQPALFEQFTLVSMGGNQYAIRTANGRYWTAVKGGGIKGPDAIHTDATKIDAFERFTLIALGPKNKYAIRTANGNYLTAVGGGGLAGVDTIHTDATQVSAWEQFTIWPR